MKTMNIERNTEVTELITMMAEVSKKLKEFASTINDEDISEMCDKIKSVMNTGVIELVALDNYIYSNDVIGWTEGNTHSTIDMAQS